MDLFKGYPNDAKHIPEYIAYAGQYVAEPRECDKIIIQMLRGASGSLLDIGCSTGNLLRHIQTANSQLGLTGGDLSEAQLAVCRADATMQSIAFEKMDILDLPADRYDYVVANAILYGFDDDDYRSALQSVARALHAGGCFIAFDFFHPYNQEISIIERTSGFPNGHPIHFRSMTNVSRWLDEAGFEAAQFSPFSIPVKLANDSTENLRTKTVDTNDGQRLMFRGALCQPWCHLKATLKPKKKP